MLDFAAVLSKPSPHLHHWHHSSQAGGDDQAWTELRKQMTHFVVYACEPSLIGVASGSSPCFRCLTRQRGGKHCLHGKLIFMFRMWNSSPPFAKCIQKFIRWSLSTQTWVLNYYKNCVLVCCSLSVQTFWIRSNRLLFWRTNSFFFHIPLYLVTTWTQCSFLCFWSWQSIWNGEDVFSQTGLSNLIRKCCVNFSSFFILLLFH